MSCAPESRGLERSLAPRHVMMISMGGIIGAGLFVGSSAAIAAAGPAVILSYLLAGLLIVLIMRMLGEMAVAMPEVRSFTEFARAGLGDWAGFMAGWLYWYFWVIVIPIEAIAGANQLHDLLVVWLDVPTWALGFALLGLMTAVNLLSARSYGEFEFWFASIKVVAIVAFIAVAGASVLGWTPHHSSPRTNLIAAGGFAPHGWTAVLAAVTTVFFAITGAEITMVAAAESVQPARAVAQLTASVIVRILVFYVISIFLIVAVISWKDVIVGQSPFTQVLLTLGLRWAQTAMRLIILTAVLSCLNSAFYVCSRVLFVLAERGDAPRRLIQLNARHVPARSVLIGALAGVSGLIANTWAPAAVFAFLVNASGALIVFVYLLICLAQIRLRRARERRAEAAAGLPMWCFPWASYAAILGMLAVLSAMAATPALASQFYVSALALLIAAGACFLVQRRRRELEPSQRTMIP
jgi:GABA permease